MRRFRRRGRLVAALLVAPALSLPVPVASQSLTLGQAVDSALATHPSLAAAEARVVAAGDAGDAARAARLPGVSVSGTLTRFEEPMVVAPFHSLDFSSPPSFDRTLVQGRLAMLYTLFDGGERPSRIRGADAVEDATRFARDASEMEVLEETASAYVGVLTARAVLEAAQAQVRALDEERARAERELEAGTAAELEVIRADAARQEALADEASARARLGLAERALARVMGVAPTTISGRPLGDVAVISPSARGDASSSPLIMRADRSVAAAEARLSEERAGRLPNVQAGAALLDFGTLDGGHVAEWQAGVQVSWPLFTGGARSASVRRAEANLAAAQSDLRMVRLQVDQAVDAAKTSVVEADARAEALALAVTQWEEVSRIEALALDAGSGVQEDLLRAQASLFQARAGHVRARYDAVVARVQLARAEGILDPTWMNEALESR